MNLKRIALALVCAGLTLPAMAVTNITPTVFTIQIDSNGVVLWPTNFFEINQVPLNATVLSNVEERILDIAEGVVDVEVPAALEDYYSKPQSDVRYLMRDSYVAPEQIAVTGTWTRLVGNTLAEILRSIDGQIGQGSSTGGVTIITNIYTTITGTTNAAGIGVTFSPQAYVPAGSNVQEHLRAIDSRLLYLASYLATNGVTPGTQTLVSVAVTGANTASEGVDEEYTLTATLSDATTTDVTTSAGATWSVGGSGAASMITNWLHTGSITSNETVSVQGTYSWRGITRLGSKLVLIVDTNPPVLASVYVSGTNAVNERGTAAYRAWALFDSGTSNDVTADATWSLSGAAGTITAGALTAGEVTSNTAAAVIAQYAYGSVIKSGTNSITVRSLDQKLVITVNYSGVYNVGTLHLDCWSDSHMQNWMLQSWTIAGFAAYGTHTITNTLTTQFAGNTYWYAWLDTDGNNILNGVLDASVVFPRNDEPAGIATIMPIALTNNADAALTFNLTEQVPGCHFRQGWLATDVGGTPRKRVQVYDMSHSGATRIRSTVLTNRTYWCEWDSMCGNYNLGTTNGAYATGTWETTANASYYFTVNKVNSDGSDDVSVAIQGRLDQ